MSTIADMEVKVRADITDLSRKMDQAGGSTEVFAKAATASVSKATKSFDSLDATFENLRATLHKNIDNSALENFTVTAKKVSGTLSVLSKDALAATGYFVRMPGVLQTTSQALAKTAVEAAKLDSTLGKKVVVGSNQAGFALTNLGRVAQDLPFGFIGIQNNLNPLLESFQRLKAETGSSKLALKALGSSLMGAGGIGFALSIASSAFLLFQNGMMGFGKKTKEAKAAVDEIAEAIKSSTLEVEKQKASFQALISIAQSDVRTKGQQADALRELNKLIPDNIGVLTTLNIRTEEGTRILAGYTKALEAKALAELLSGRIANLSVKKMDLVNARDLERIKDINEQNKVLAKLNKDQRSAGPFQIASEAYATRQLDRVDAINKVQRDGVKIWDDYGKQINSVESDISRYRKEIENATAASLDLTDPKQGKIKAVNPVKIEKPEVDKLAKVFQKYFRDTLNENPISLPFEIAFDNQQVAEKIKNAYKTQFAPKDQIEPIQLGISVNPFANAGDLDRLEKTAFLVGQGSALSFVDGLKSVPFEEFYTKAKATFDKIKALNQEMADNLKNALVSSLQGIGESLGTALAKGGDVGQAVFGSLFETLSQGIIELGKAMVTLGTAKIAIEKFNFAPGIGTVVAGIATIALGSLMRSSIPKFATGVENFAGGMALVGERGPELVNLPRGSDVIPNRAIGGFGGGVREVPYIAETRVSGGDLRLILQRADGRAARNG